jgi:serine/threonine-protein kinase RsbW
VNETLGERELGDTSDTDQPQSPGPTGVVRVRVTNGPLVGPVLRRIVSIVLARADWPLDSLDDALLVCDSLSAHAPAHARERCVAVTLRANEREAELRVSELTCDGATRLLEDATLPVVGNVLRSIAEKVLVEGEEGGEGSQLVLVLSSG